MNVKIMFSAAVDVFVTATRPCRVGRRRCPTTQRCVRSAYFCDGDNDCGDYSDERRDECREYPSGLRRNTHKMCYCRDTAHL